MAISIDWGTKVISVPKADLTLVQTTPTEIREMNLNWFRLKLKDLEDSEDGMAFLDTHRHFTEVELGGITYARVIEIINGYTVTFEDGQYAVNLVGANSNVGDVVNVNQVSIRSANAAGLISNAAIEFSSFNGGVSWDSANGYDAGTEFPAGTPQRPLKNLDDVMLVADLRGFTTIYALADGAITDVADFSNMTFVGESIDKTTLTILDAATVVNCEFYEATITGVLDGNAQIKNCKILDLNYIYGVVVECLLGPGTIELGGNADANFLDCWSGDVGGGYPTIDCGGTGQDLALRRYSGEIRIENSTGTNTIIVDLDAGRVEIAATITTPNVTIRGTGEYDNQSTITVDDSSLINRDLISLAVWDEAVADHVVSGSSGEALRYMAFSGQVSIDTNNGHVGTAFPIGTQYRPVNNFSDAMTIAAGADLARFHLNGAMTLGADFQEKRITGIASLLDDVLDLGGYDVSSTHFYQLGVIGTMIGQDCIFNECLLTDVDGAAGILFHSAIQGTIKIGAGKTLLATRTNFVSKPVTLDMGAGGAFQGDISGEVKIVNLHAGSFVSLGFGYGNCEIDASCDGGTVILAGGAGLTDNSTGVTLVNELNNVQNVQTAVWDAEEEESSAWKLAHNRNRIDTTTSQLVVYEADGTTEWKRFDLKDEAGNPATEPVFEREPV